MSRQTHLEHIDVAAAIIQRKQEILLSQRRASQSYPGYWEFPGGKIEPGETVYAGLSRELSEELGIIILLAQPWKTLEYTYPERHVSLHIWHITRYQGEPMGKEGQTIVWVNNLTLPDITLLPANQTLLLDLRAYFQLFSG